MKEIKPTNETGNNPETEQEKTDGGGKTQKEKPAQTGRRGATQNAHHRRDSAICRQTGGELGRAV